MWKNPPNSLKGLNLHHVQTSVDCEWDFVVHGRCFRRRYEVYPSDSVHTDNHFLGKFDANFEHLSHQFQKFFENLAERLLSIRID